MKKISRFLLVAMCILAGCVVSSVCPFYTGQDLVTTPLLSGTWSATSDKDKPETWRFDEGPGHSYRLTMTSPGDVQIYIAHAFRLRGQLFLDMSSTNTADLDVLPMHTIMKVALNDPKVLFALMNYDWLTNYVATNPAAVQHVFVQTSTDYTRLVLTAETPGLQSFLGNCMNTGEAWTNSISFSRETTKPKP
jgi:hypothetical protein